MKFIYFLIILVAGFGMIKYYKLIVDHTMRFDWVENALGPGGTYTFWKLAGIAVALFSFYYLFNV